MPSAAPRLPGDDDPREPSELLAEMRPVTTDRPSLSHPRYSAGEVLGAGGQGVVFRVTDAEQPSRPLVAKLWREGHFARDELRGEFALLARLRIAGLVRAHDLGTDERTGAPFFVEDLVPGPDAREFVAGGDGERIRARLLRVLADVASTLAGLHEAGFLHGDLKPAHVRVPPSGRATLLDLGSAVARASGDSSRGISPGFASPEILAGASPTVSSDLYALGALTWACATGDPPRQPPRARGPLRAIAPWVPPAIADLVETLLSEHPADRPATARDVLAAIGVTTLARDAGSAPAPVGRDQEMTSLLALAEIRGVHYLDGPSGSGKSHLLRELATRALLNGQPVRQLGFPGVEPRLLVRLLSYLRGEEAAFPFARPSGELPLLVLLDELHLAPPELVASLDAFRCRGGSTTPISFVAALRSAPPGAGAISLGPLSAGVLTELATSLGGATPIEAARAARSAEGSPGWLLAALGRVPIAVDSVQARVRSLSDGARHGLGLIAVVGGAARGAWLHRALGPSATGVTTELLAASLVGRRLTGADPIFELTSPAVTADVARALGEFDVVDAAATAVLEDDLAPAAALLSVARADNPPARREELLRRGAATARANGLRTEEIEALLGLAADARQRDGALLCRLERLTRDAGTSASHPQVLDWLGERAESEPRLLPLLLRRRAEAAARRGEHDEAIRLANESKLTARRLGDAGGEALAGAALGLVLLFRADWENALVSLRDARAAALAAEVDDAEELARLDHNLGVVAVYRGFIDEAVSAFERSLAVKQRLGDRAGVRACLRNLGYALTRAGRYEDSVKALDQAIALAVALGQSAGLAWCLAARAEVEARRGAPRVAERFVADAEALGESVPAAVRGDLHLLRSEIALLEGDGRAALAALGRLDPALRNDDVFVDARALALEARAYLACLPARRRESARSAIASLRRARSAGLPEPAEMALEALRAARGLVATGAPVVRYAPRMTGEADDETWDWLARVAGGVSLEDCVADLLGALVRRAGAERAFLAIAEPSGAIARAFGVDLDGLAIGDAERRLPVDLVLPALASAAPVYLRSVATPGGEGARLAVASRGDHGAARALLLLEHRFTPGRFDALDETTLHRFATLAALALRLAPARVETRSQSSAPAAVDPGPLLRRAPPHGDIDVTTLHPLDRPRRDFPTLHGKSPAFLRALSRLDAAVDGDLPALILGETGVGKELFARALHDHGPRAKAPFVAVNCAAIPDSLFEAELFGHSRGAFTGADRARAGLLAKAEGGTLFLDEIGELGLPRQASLLRVLESRRYRPVGSDEEKSARVRIVAATNRDLETRVEEGTFRQDLLFRLNVLTLRIPPLRERSGDAVALARRFLEDAGSRAKLAPRVELALAAYAWPGNVRELEHVMARLAALPVDRLDLAHLPREIRGAVMAPAESPRSETEQVKDALASAKGNISQAAKTLGITRHGLKKRMVRLGMRDAKTVSRGHDDDLSTSILDAFSARCVRLRPRRGGASRSRRRRCKRWRIWRRRRGERRRTRRGRRRERRLGGGNGRRERRRRRTTDRRRRS